MGRLLATLQPAFQEVDLFFRHLEEVDRKLEAPGRSVTTEDREVLSILKATSFLVLYNVAEASIRACVEAIAEAIQNQKLPLGSISERILTLLVRKRLLKPLRSGAASGRAERLALDLMIESANGTTPVVPVDSLPISGNVDAEKIRELGCLFGFEVNPPLEAKGGDCLTTIKNRRNHLGHGNQSFADVGNDYVVSDLTDFKKEFELYLEATLQGVEDYLNRRRYDLGTVLSDIDELEPAQKDALVREFGSPLAVFSATVEELQQVPGIGYRVAQGIVNAGKAVRLTTA